MTFQEKTENCIVIDRSSEQNDIAKQLLNVLLPPLERLRNTINLRNNEFDDELAHQELILPLMPQLNPECTNFFYQLSFIGPTYQRLSTPSHYTEGHFERRS